MKQSTTDVNTFCALNLNGTSSKSGSPGQTLLIKPEQLLEIFVATPNKIFMASVSENASSLQFALNSSCLIYYIGTHLLQIVCSKAKGMTIVFLEIISFLFFL